MKTNTAIGPNGSESSLQVTFGEIFQIKNILIGLLLLIGNFFKDKHLLRYTLVLAGLLATTILAPLLSAYPEFFGRWKYVIRIFFAFPIIYFILVMYLPSTFQIMKTVFKNSAGTFQKYQNTLLTLAVLQFCFFILVSIGILAHGMLLDFHLLLWLGWLTFKIFEEQE